MCVCRLDKTLWPSAMLFWKFEWEIRVISEGHFVSFPHLWPCYWDLLYLWSKESPLFCKILRLWGNFYYPPVVAPSSCGHHRRCKTDGHMFVVIPREGQRKSGNRIWAWQERIMTMLHKSVLIHSCILTWFHKVAFCKTGGEENDFIIKQNNKCHQLYICCSVQDI